MINFLVVGAEKCATTSLFRYLNEHSQIHMPPQKRLVFLLLMISIRMVCLGMKIISHLASKTNLKKLFMARFLLNICFVLKHQKELKKIILIKIVMILRNPIDRALSAYRMLYNRKDLNLGFSESVKILFR